MMKSIKVFAPATVSNIGCGFDTMGFAIHELGDEIIVKPNSLNKLRIVKITGDHKKLPLKPESNTATVAMAALLKALRTKQGFDIRINKKMPLCSGLGSSAASAVAGAFAINKILDSPFALNDVLEFALKGEFLASKSLHADNAAPALFGGFILIRDYDPIDLIKIEAPPSLYCIILHPDVEINTGESRKLIKKKIDLKDALTHFGNIGAFITALHTKNYELLGRSIEDKIAEPLRGNMIPAYYRIKDAALNQGAFGCNISGSGPSVFAFGSTQEQALKIGRAMKREIHKTKITSQVYISKINNNGAIIIG